LEKIDYKNEKFYIGRYIYFIKICKICLEEYFTNDKNSKYCSKLCSNKYYTEKVKKEISVLKKGEKNGMFGKKHSKEVREKISNTLQKKTGGFAKKNIVPYYQYSHLLDQYHKIKNNNDMLEVKCTYCGKWYKPTYREVNNRLYSIYYRGDGGNNLYCSKECKLNCPTYNQKKYPKGFKPSTSREVQPELRKLVFERDSWSCVKCKEVKNLHCHHIDPVTNNPIESADINNCVTLCYTCHKEVHKLPGCKYNEPKC